MNFSFRSIRTAFLLLGGMTAATLSAQPLLPVETDFESDEGAVSGTSIFSPWTFLGGTMITDLDSASGGQSIRLPGGLEGSGIFLDVAPGEGVQFVDFYLKPAATGFDQLPESLPEDTTVAVAFVRGETEGEVYALHAGPDAAVWIPTGTTRALEAVDTAADWIRYTFRIDYPQKVWDLYLDETLVAVELGFYNPAISSLQTFSLDHTGDAPAGFDFFYAGPENPLFADADRDGIPDAYEIRENLNYLANDRYGDVDRDALFNLLEYWYGLQAGNPDSDGDGIPDGWELQDGTNPLVAEPFSLSILPFLEGFEDVADPAALSNGWLLDDPARASLADPDPFQGLQSLTLHPHEENDLVLENPFVSPANAVVWIDFHLDPGLHTKEYPPELPPRTSAGFYFDQDDRLVAWDGLTAAWLPLTDPAASGWRRLTLRLDYASQTWKVWVDGVRVSSLLGFAHAVPYFNRFKLRQLPGDGKTARLDAVRIALDEPADLDNDGDGMENQRELNLGSDPETPEDHGPILGLRGLKLWLRADSGVATDPDGGVSSWADLSGTLTEALQTDPAKRPLLQSDAFNGHPAVRFDGLDDFLRADSAFNPGAENFTLLLVHRRTGGHDLAAPLSYSTTLDSYGAPLLRWGPEPDEFGINEVGFGPAGVYNLLGADNLDNFYITTVTRHGGLQGLGGTLTLKTLGESGTWIDTGAQTWTSGDADAFFLGRKRVTGDHYYGGDIAEVLAFNRVLDPALRLDLERMLGEKYGLDLDVDADGLPDAWEAQYLGTTDLGPLDDPDGDGVGNLREYNLGTDPGVADPYEGLMAEPALALWLDAAAGVTADPDTAVSAWTDRSGNLADALQTDPAARPHLVQDPQGDPAVRFDGVDDFLQGASAFDASAGDYTLVAVHRRSTPEGLSAVLSYSTSETAFGAPLLRWGPEDNAFGVNAVGLGADGVYVDCGPDTYDHTWIASARRVGGTMGEGGDLTLRMLTDGTTLEAAAAQNWISGSTDAFYVGRKKAVDQNNNDRLRGEVLEILVYSRALTDAELREVEERLGAKHGLALDVDADGLLDDWEFAHFGDLAFTATDDPDADGISNAREYNLGTDPDALEDLGPVLSHPGLQAWLRADRGVAADATGTVLSWTDQSGRLRELLPESTSGAPLWITDGFQDGPAVQFDGLDDVLLGEAGFDASSEDVTIMLVHARTGGHDKAAPISFMTTPAAKGAPLLRYGPEANHFGVNEVGYGPAGLYHDLGPEYLGQPYISTMTREGGVMGQGGTLHLRTATHGASQESIGTQTWTSEPSTTFTLGRKKPDADHYYGGVIAEVLVFKGALTEADLRVLEADLAARHGLALDSDNDGLPDSWELAHGLDPYDAADAASDADGDTLAASEEYARGTDPNSADTDGDWLADDAELALGADPLNTDSDGDLLADGIETVHGLDPVDPTDAPAPVSLAKTLHFNTDEGFVSTDDLPEDWRVEEGSLSFGGPSSSDSKWRSLRLSKDEPTTIRTRAPLAVAGKRQLMLAVDTSTEVVRLEELATLPTVVDTLQLAWAVEFEGDDWAQLHALTATGWIPLDHWVPLDEEYTTPWTELSLWLDFETKHADVFADGTRLATLPFIDPDANVFTGYAWTGLGHARSHIDYLRLSDGFVGDAWFHDIGDSLPVGWKHANGYDWRALLDRDADEDADGRSLYEEMLRGSDPQVADAPAPAHGLLHQVWTDDQLAGTQSFDFIGTTPPAEETWHVGPLLYNADFQPEEQGMKYGRRLRGYITPEESGWYTFAGVWDKSGEIWLSTDGSAFNKQRIAYSESWLFDEEWEKWPGQRSLPVHLEAGQAYYLEILGRGVVYNELYGLRWQHHAWDDPQIIPETVLTPYAYDFTEDTDGDDLPDAVEVMAGLDPANPWLDQGALGDPDADGITNHAELARLLTDPLETETLPVPAREACFDLSTATGTELAAPWISSVIGSAAPGDAFHIGDAIALTAEGINYAYGSEASHYLSWRRDHGQAATRQMTGNFRITARVRIEKADDGAAVAGLFAAEDLGDRPVRAALFATADDRVIFSTRTREGSSADGIGPGRSGEVPDDHWLRLSRRGTVVTAERSFDGESWTVYDTSEAPLAETLHIGPFASSQSPTRQVAALFLDLEVEEDTDGDGLYDDEETALGTDPTLADTDGDGFSDGFEVETLGTDPLVHDHSSISDPVAAATGSEATPLTGTWRVEGDTVYSLDYRGKLETGLSVPEAGFYRLDVVVREANAYRDISRFELLADLNGYSLGARVDSATPGTPVTLKYWLPWLPEGPITIGLDWVNVDPGSTLRLEAVQLVRLDFQEDTTREAWEAHRLAEELVLPDSPDQTSRISPWTLYGQALRLDGMDVIAENSPDPIEVRRALSDTFYSEVPLHPAAAALGVEISTHQGLTTRNLDVRWEITPVNLPQEEVTRMRAGDRILLGWQTDNEPVPPYGVYLEIFKVADLNQGVGTTPDQDSYWNLSRSAEGGDAISVDALSAFLEDAADPAWSESFTERYQYNDGSASPFGNQADRTIQPMGAAPGTLPLRLDAFGLQGDEVATLSFDTQGSYVVVASWRDAEGLPHQTMHPIQTLAADLGTPVAVTTGYTREWTPPYLPAAMWLEGDKELLLIETPDVSPRRFSLSTSATQPLRVVARLGSEGPVADLSNVHPLVNYGPMFNTGLRILNSYEDGSRLVEFTVALGGDLPEGVEIVIHPIIAGVTFDDGSIEKIVTAEDLDELGRYRYRLIAPAGVDLNACHYQHVQQDGQGIDIRY